MFLVLALALLSTISYADEPSLCLNEVTSDSDEEKSCQQMCADGADAYGYCDVKYCETTKVWMHANCPNKCGFCPGTTSMPVMSTEGPKPTMEPKQTTSAPKLEPCMCVTTWSDPDSGGSCSEEQSGCPAAPCDGDSKGRWCLTTEAKCATSNEGGSWAHCDDSTPVFGQDAPVLTKLEQLAKLFTQDQSPGKAMSKEALRQHGVTVEDLMKFDKNKDRTITAAEISELFQTYDENGNETEDTAGIDRTIQVLKALFNAPVLTKLEQLAKLFTQDQSPGKAMSKEALRQHGVTVQDLMKFDKNKDRTITAAEISELFQTYDENGNETEDTAGIDRTIQVLKALFNATTTSAPTCKNQNRGCAVNSDCCGDLQCAMKANMLGAKSMRCVESVPAQVCRCPIGRRALAIFRDALDWECQETSHLKLQVNDHSCPDGTTMKCEGPQYECRDENEKVYKGTKKVHVLVPKETTGMPKPTGAATTTSVPKTLITYKIRSKKKPSKEMIKALKAKAAKALPGSATKIIVKQTATLSLAMPAKIDTATKAETFLKALFKHLPGVTVTVTATNSRRFLENFKVTIAGLPQDEDPKMLIEADKEITANLEEQVYDVEVQTTVPKGMTPEKAVEQANKELKKYVDENEDLQTSQAATIQTTGKEPTKAPVEDSGLSAGIIVLIVIIVIAVIFLIGYFVCAHIMDDGIGNTKDDAMGEGVEAEMAKKEFKSTNI